MPTKKNRNIATNAYRLLSGWSIVPGTLPNGQFNPDAFSEWLTAMEAIAKATGHYDVALIQLGDVLIHSPEGPDGLWIHSVIAEAMNNRERSCLRKGYGTSLRNSRGVYTVDPEAKPEKALAKKYREQAEAVENCGYQRLATTLREVANSYDQDAERIISNGGRL